MTFYLINTTMNNYLDIIVPNNPIHYEREVRMKTMTDKQMQFIAWLITTATDKCQTIEEVRAMNEEIRKHSAGLKVD